MAARSILEYILRAKKEGDATQQASAELETFSSKAQSAGNTAKSVLGGGLKAASYGAAALVPIITSAAVESVQLAQDMEKAELALTAYAGSSEEAEKATIAVTNAAGGAISKLQATQTATRLFSMGLADSAEQAGKLTEMAITLGAAVGEDAASSIENFSLMLANQSIPRLDSFGISGAAVRERMEELQAATEGLDRQTAFMIATMELGTDKLNALNAAGFEATNSIDTLKASTEDFKTEMGEGLAPVVDKGAGILSDFVSTVTDAVSAENKLKEAAELGIITREEANDLINKATWTSYTFSDALEYVRQKEDEQKAAQEELNVAITAAEEPLIRAKQASGDYGGSLDETSDSTDGLTDATEKLVISIGKVTEAKLAQEAIEALTKAFDEGTISEDTYAAAANNVMINISGYTNLEASASIALSKLKKAFDDGEISSYAYYQAVLALNNQISSLPSYKRVEVEYVETRTGSGATGRSGRRTPYQLGGSFRVVGPPGLDTVPVSFMATRNETVTITPQGLPAPGSRSGITIDARGAQFFGVAGIEDFANQMLPYLEDAARNA